jgi:hypothetical protein
MRGTPLTTVLAEAWSRYRPFLKYGDRERYPPEMSSQETLLKHTINATFRPKVRVLVDGAEVGTIDFEVALRLKLEGGEVTIQDGRITELRPGKCWIEGTLSCEGVVLAERASAEHPLPGVISFGEGIPVAPAAEPVEETVAADP